MYLVNKLPKRLLAVLILSTSIYSTTQASNKLGTLEGKNAWEIASFKLKGIDNKIHRLDEWKGKVILLNFWASWCSPCIKEIKDFRKYQIHFKDNNFQIVSIAIDKSCK
jgi:thiol-disulfide isomerase/thioredoxin